MAFTNRLSLEDLVVFETIARAGSFSAAADELGLTPSAVSRALTRMEDKLGVQLIRRSTRTLALTPEGEILVEGAPSVLAGLEALEIDLTERKRFVKGDLRVSVGTAMAETVVVPHLPAFMARYPEVILDLNVTDRRADLLRDRVDVAIRTGELADTTFRAKRIGSGRRIICASPDYLARFGKPTSPEDLTRHRCLVFTGFDHLRHWPLSKGAKVTNVKVTPALQSDSALTLKRMASAGLGIAWVADFVVADAIADGRLIPVLEEFYTGDVFPIWALFAPAERVPLRVRAFLDFLTEEAFGRRAQPERGREQLDTRFTDLDY